MKHLWVLLSRVVLPLRREPTAWEKTEQAFLEAAQRLCLAFNRLTISTEEAAGRFNAFSRLLAEEELK